MPSTRACVHPSVRMPVPHIFTYTLISDSFIKISSPNLMKSSPGYVYGYENLSVQNFGLILKNKMATIANCFKIIKMP